MRKQLLCIIALLIAAFNWQAHSVPAFPRPIVATQPDGTEVTLRVRGDETFHWTESLQGNVVMQSASGYWEYAIVEGDAVVPSGIRMTNDDTQAGVQLISSQQMGQRSVAQKYQHSLPSAKHGASVRNSSTGYTNFGNGLQSTGSFPTKGKRKLLMILVNYANTTITFTAEDFSRLMNETNYATTGSFRDFFLENSYGQLDIETTVVGWIQLASNKEMYSTEDMRGIIGEALQGLDESIDLNDYDNDGDGVLDGLSIIHQGTGQEVSGSSSDIWSHSALVQGLSRDGVMIGKYTIQPEVLYGNLMCTVGVLCHEFGHNLGAPDFYDADYSTNGEFLGTGNWDLMAGGIWNQSIRPGDSPSHVNMWQKIMFGWVTPQYLDASQAIADMPAACDEPVAYVVNTQRDGDYYVLENRQQKNFDRKLPGHGLIAYHVDESRVRNSIVTNRINSSSSQSVYTVVANSDQNPGGYALTYGDIDSQNAPFPGAGKRTSFSDETVPSLISNDGKNSFRELSGITEKSGLISFDFVQRTIPEKVGNFRAEAIRNNVSLSWNRPSNNDYQSFRIYRNDEYLASTTDTTYIDNVENEVLIEYKIEVVYSDAITSPFSSAVVRFPVNRVAQINSDIEDSRVTLTWEMNELLSRIKENDMSDGTPLYLSDASNVWLAQLYREADLKTYLGYQIKAIHFFPFTKPETTKYIITVWRKAAGAALSEAQIVAERNASEYGSGTWRRLNLKSPVTIEKGYDYLFGVQVTSTEASLPVVCSATILDEGYGNLYFQNGEWHGNVLDGNIWVRALLANGTIEGEFIAGEQPTFNPNADPYIDGCYPLGFNIYRNDTFIGFSSKRIFVDGNAPVGEHTYSVSCLYENGSESAIQSHTVNIEESGIETASGDAVAVVSCDDGIVVSVAAESTLEVFTIDGRTIKSVIAHPGSNHYSLPAGIYLVRTGNRVFKTIVK